MSKTFDMRVPQLGESTRSVKVLRILKREGDCVDADENLLEVETNKAVMEISAPVSGVVKEILADIGATIDVGDVIVRIDSQNSIPAVDSSFGQKRKGDQSAFRASNDEGWRVATLPAEQTSLIRNMLHSKQEIVQVSIETQINWSDIDEIKKSYRKSGADKISSLGLFVWACGDAMASFEKFRSRLIDEKRIDVNENALIGIAKSLENDVLMTPVVTYRGGMTPLVVQSKVSDLLSDADASSSYHSLSISDMSAFDVIRGAPVVVSPSVATLFIGTPYWGINNDGSPSRISNLVLSFDHRIMNGAYAAKFLSRVKRNIETLLRKDIRVA